MVFYFKKSEICAFLHFFLGNIRKVSFFAFGSMLENFFFKYMPVLEYDLFIVGEGCSVYHKPMSYTVLY